jgi:predicted ester cyclase
MSEAKELLAMHVRAFNERAWGRASEIYAPDLIVVEPAGTVHGVDAFLGHAQGFTTAFPDSRMEVTTVIESGDQAVMEGVYAGTNTGPLATPQGELPPTGRKLALPLCEMCEVVAGRIAVLRVYYDQMSFAGQMGLLPEPVTAG